MTDGFEPTPSFPRFVISLARCVRRAPDLVSALAPRAWPQLADRLALQIQLDTRHGARHIRAIHEVWLGFVGRPEPELLGGGLVDAGEIARRDRRVAALEDLSLLSAEVDRALDVLVDPSVPVADEVRAQAWLIAGCAAPVRLPLLVASMAIEQLVRTAPPLPPVRRAADEDTTLLTDLVVEALPGLLASAAARHIVGRIPKPLVIGIRAGRHATTVLLGSDRIEVRNGLRGEVAVLIQGGIEPLLRRVGGRLEREVAGLEEPRP